MSTDWIRRWDRFVELESTSTHLAQLWRSGELEASQTPIVVVTEQQTAGRGRGDHRAVPVSLQGLEYRFKARSRPDPE